MKTYIIQASNSRGYIFFYGPLEAAKKEALKLADETGQYTDMWPLERRGLKPAWRIFSTAQQREIAATTAQLRARNGNAKSKNA